MSSGVEGVHRGLLALLAASQEGIRGRTRAQKFAYFAGLMGASDFSKAKFKHHDFGPYSRQVSDCLRWLVVSGLVREDRENLEENKALYTYLLTEDGESWIENNKPEEFEMLRRISSTLIDADIATLELAATAQFLQQKSKSKDVEGALEMAISRRPSHEKVRAKAKQLLESL